MKRTGHFNVNQKKIINRLLNRFGLELNRVPGFGKVPGYFPLELPGIPFENTIVDFYGPSGVGKTTLANFIWKASGSPIPEDLGETFQELGREEEVSRAERALLHLLARKFSMMRLDSREDIDHVMGLYSWVLGVVKLQRKMLRQKRKASYLVSHDGFFHAFGPTIFSLSDKEVETIAPILQGRACVFLSASPETIAKRLFGRSQSGVLHPAHRNRTSEELSRAASLRLGTSMELSDFLAARGVRVLHVDASPRPEDLVGPVMDWLNELA
jgi:hypothetical protein